jgi:hypothetical protein
MEDRKKKLGFVAVALATGLVALGIGSTVSFADDKAYAAGSHAAGSHAAHGAAVGHAASHAPANSQDPHAYEETMKYHAEMMRGAEGTAKIKEMMLKMAAHQHLLGEAAAAPELKKLAQTPELKRAIEEVRTSLKDRAALDARKAELLKDHDEMMMIVAHALLKQDAETERMLKAAEAGGDAAKKDDPGAHKH